MTKVGVTTESGRYQCKKLTMREYLPVMDADNVSVEIMKLAVFDSSGVLLGDNVLDLTITDYKKVMDVGIDLNSFSGDTKGEAGAG